MSKTAAIVIGLSLLAGCNDIQKRQAQADNGVAPTAVNPFGGGPIVPPPLSPESPDGRQPTAGIPNAPAPGPGLQLFGEPEVAQVDETFYFTPDVSNRSPRQAFSVQNLPAWADFDATNGMISGTPAISDAGVHVGITIGVSDGESSAELGPMQIEVLANGDRSVTIAWQPPTTYDDGTPLTDLGGYTIRLGRAEGSYDRVIDVSNPGLTSYAVDGLVAGTYFFATTAYDGIGAESAFSAVVSGKIP